MNFLKQQKSNMSTTPAHSTQLAPSVASPSPAAFGAIAQQPVKQKQPNRSRNIQQKICLNEAENIIFRRKLEKSGLTAQEYLWRASLGKPLKVIDPEVLDAIAELYLELDSYADALREIIAHNQVYREKDPEGWACLLNSIEAAEETKQKCIEALEEAPDEYRKTRRQP